MSKDASTLIYLLVCSILIKIIVANHSFHGVRHQLDKPEDMTKAKRNCPLPIYLVLLSLSHVVIQGKHNNRLFLPPSLGNESYVESVGVVERTRALKFIPVHLDVGSVTVGKY